MTFPGNLATIGLVLGAVFGLALGCAGAPPMPDTRAREALILGSPPRVAPLAPDAITEEMRDAVAQLTGRVTDAASSERPEVPDMLATMVRHPTLLAPHLTLAGLLLTRGELAPRDRELTVLRVAWLCLAPYEWGEHVEIGKRVGLRADEIERIIEGSTAPGWNGHDRAILAAVEELHADAMISDETWAELERDLDDRQLIELLILVGQYHTVAYYQNALRLTLREGSAGLSAR